MFWQKKRGWFGDQLNKNTDALHNGDKSRIPWIFCVFAEKHDASKLAAAKALNEILISLSYDDVVRIDEQMRQKTSMEWSINWHKLNINDFFTSQMSESERCAIIIFASFNPNGFIREKAVQMMKNFDGTLPYIILRQNDWVLQVRQTASSSFNHRLKNLSDGEILAALPYADKLRRCNRGSYGEYTEMFFKVLTQPTHEEDLLEGLKSAYVRTRRICTDALFNASCPKIDLAFERLTREPEPFLRAIIFNNLHKLGQKMDDVICAFLNDNYPKNRLLAFQYLLDTDASNIIEIAEKLLLDRSAVVRIIAQDTIQKKTPEFDFRNFYFSNFSLYPATSICGLGEKGVQGDAVEIEKYLNDNRIGVVKSAMASLMRLDCEKYSSEITEMLDDERAGIVKTARNLVLKIEPNYERIKEIFNKTLFEHTKIKCMEILFFAPKWDSIIYMLETMSSNEEIIKAKSLVAIQRWLYYFNRSFTLPSRKQNDEIRNLSHSLKGILPSSIERELLFSLPAP